MGHVRCLKGITITNPNDPSGTTAGPLAPYIRHASTLKYLAAEMRGDVIIAPGHPPAGSSSTVAEKATLSFYSQPNHGSSIDPTTNSGPGSDDADRKAYINTDGEASFSKLDIQGKFTVTGPLEVDGTAEFQHDVTMDENLTVDGTLTVKDTLYKAVTMDKNSLLLRI